MITIQDKNFKVGVGVITTGKRPLPDYRTEQGGADLKVFMDSDRKGPGFGRNTLIKSFYDEGYDYWFIFDDDVYPTEPSHVSYIKYFTDVAYKNNFDCFMSPEFFRDSIIGSDSNGEVLLFDSGLIQFLFCSRKMIETVGYIPLLPSRYGYEDTLYLFMIVEAQRKGLLNKGVYGVACPSKALCYLHPADMYADNTTAFHNMSFEEKEASISSNKDYFEFMKVKIMEGKHYFSFEEAMRAE